MAGRSQSLLKVKRFSDAEALVIGHEAGKGRLADVVGALACKLKNGITCVHCALRLCGCACVCMRVSRVLTLTESIRIRIRIIRIRRPSQV